MFRVQQPSTTESSVLSNSVRDRDNSSKVKFFQSTKNTVNKLKNQLATQFEPKTEYEYYSTSGRRRVDFFRRTSATFPNSISNSVKELFQQSVFLRQNQMVTRLLTKTNLVCFSDHLRYLSDPLVLYEFFKILFTIYTSPLLLITNHVRLEDLDEYRQCLLHMLFICKKELPFRMQSLYELNLTRYVAMPVENIEDRDIYMFLVLNLNFYIESGYISLARIQEILSNRFPIVNNNSDIDNRSWPCLAIVHAFYEAIVTIGPDRVKKTFDRGELNALLKELFSILKRNNRILNNNQSVYQFVNDVSENNQNNYSEDGMDFEDESIHSQAVRPQPRSSEFPTETPPIIDAVRSTGTSSEIVRPTFRAAAGSYPIRGILKKNRGNKKMVRFNI